METAPLYTDYKNMGKPSLAQFFTPACVARFVWQVLEEIGGRLTPDMRIIDPAAGVGGLVDWVLDNGSLKPQHVYGVELDGELVDWRRRHKKQGRFYVGDGLLDVFEGVQVGSFDIVVGNPPFGRTDRIFTSNTYLALAKRYVVWQQENQQVHDLTRLRGFPIDVLFVERALELVRPQGLVAMIMPEGLLANIRLQAARDWILTQAQLLTVIDLPTRVFRRAGLNAKTALVVLRKRGLRKNSNKSVWLLDTNGRQSLDGLLHDALGQIKQIFSQSRRLPVKGVQIKEKALRGCRWDIGHWQGQRQVCRLRKRFRLSRLGDYITHLTYGPIVTGQRPEHRKRGIRVIRQGDFGETGLHLEDALRVGRGSVYDPLRSRVCQGDLLLPRSGVGALGRNRLAVYMEKQPANIGCFVDLIRLVGLNAFYAWIFFKTAPGWEQIRACANGVGTPNINFGEIRNLSIPLLPEEMQYRVEQRYCEEIWPLHKQIGQDKKIGEALFFTLVADLQNALSGNKSVF